jgi:AbrB family looped-hinge helix DNA binding protein
MADNVVRAQRMGGNGSVGGTIPAEIAEEHGIEPGTPLLVDNEEDGVRLRPVE